MLALLLATLLSFPAPARAATLRVSAASGIPDFLGPSLSLTALRPLELEVGASGFIFMLSWYARGGVALPLEDDRDADGKGLLLEGLGLVGYRELWIIIEPDRIDMLDAVGGVEATGWFGKLAVDGQLLAGVSVGVGEERGVLPNLRLAAGIAF